MNDHEDARTALEALSFRVVSREESERIYEHLMHVVEFELLLKRELYKFASQSGIEMYDDMMDIVEAARVARGLGRDSARDAVADLSTPIVLRQGNARFGLPQKDKFPHNYYAHVATIFVEELVSRLLEPDDYNHRIPNSSTRELLHEKSVIERYKKPPAFNRNRVITSIETITKEITRRG